MSEWKGMIDKMTIQDKFETICGSFAIENMDLTEQDKERVKSILNGEHDADYYITQLDQKYGLARNA